MAHPQRRSVVWLLSLFVLLFTSAVHAGGAELRRSKKPEKIWEHGARGRAGADARPIIDQALKDAGLPEGVNNNPWRDLIHQYWKLDHMAQGEPRSYTNGKYVPNAWFTHGARHFLDLVILITDNKQFVKDMFLAQGLNTDAKREQAFKDLLAALIGHDSQQLGFASPREATREKARTDHPFNGGVATALAHLAGPGTHAPGIERAMMLAMAAAGHSKSAVDFVNADGPKGANTMFARILAEVNNKNGTNHTIADAQRDAIIAQARRIGTVLGAMDALRERGKNAFGSHPTGEHMIYKVEGTNANNKVLVVFNQKEAQKVTELKETGERGIDHRSYVEYHTDVQSVKFDGTKFDIRVEFSDADISTDKRRQQAEDIQKDFARTGFECIVRFKTFDGGWGKAD